MKDLFTLEQFKQVTKEMAENYNDCSLDELERMYEFQRLLTEEMGKVLEKKKAEPFKLTPTFTSMHDFGILVDAVHDLEQMVDRHYHTMGDHYAALDKRIDALYDRITKMEEKKK